MSRIATGLEKSSDDGCVACVCRDVQGRGAAAIDCVNAGTSAQQPFDGRKISVPRGVVQLGGCGVGNDQKGKRETGDQSHRATILPYTLKRKCMTSPSRTR